MLKIVISKDAQYFLANIPTKHAQQIVHKIDLLAKNPSALPTITLAGHPTLKRLKSGEYRVIFKIENDCLHLYILRIGKRNDGEVYRKLENLK